jgi:hypothetical protein
MDLSTTVYSNSAIPPPNLINGADAKKLVKFLSDEQRYEMEQIEKNLKVPRGTRETLSYFLFFVSLFPIIKQVFADNVPFRVRWH